MIRGEDYPMAIQTLCDVFYRTVELRKAEHLKYRRTAPGARSAPTS